MTGIAETLLSMPRAAKRLLALAVDAILCVLTVFLAYALRLDGFVYPVGTQWLSYGLSLAIALPIFISFGLYRAIFRYSGIGATLTIIKACALYGAIYALIFTLYSFTGIPRTTGLLQPPLLFLAVAASRTVARFVLGRSYMEVLGGRKRRRAVIYGAGDAGRQLAAALGGTQGMKLIAFLDDDPARQGSTLDGKKIYPPSKLGSLIRNQEVEDVLLALPSASRRRRNEIIGTLRKHPVAIRTLPAVIDMAHGKVTVSDLHELDIEDLLGRDPVAPDVDLLRTKCHGKTVLVTGAGGSIGSELCRQIVALEPTRMLLLDINEYNLYAIHSELKRIAGKCDVLPLLGSVTDAKRVERIIATFAPETVYHAAAYKHVPIVEHNPLEGIRNNVFGTLTTAQIARKHKVKDFVLISTDKAVRPSNIMGMTKRMAELVLQALSAEPGDTRFSMVRFGNVLGSSGSVVPLFRGQIAKGGPVTVTDERITRYFMTIPEAAQLVLQAGAMAEGGDVFLLEMGEPVKIVDLARRMIELSGLTVRDAKDPAGDIGIEFVGLRPGEKLYEELLIGEGDAETDHPRIRKAHENFIPWPELKATLDTLAREVDAGNITGAREILLATVPENTSGGEESDWIALGQIEQESRGTRQAS